MSLKVGVIRGGPSSEYEVSLKTGGNVLKFLSEKYKKADILITKNGEWHLNGIPEKPEKIFRHIDIAFNATHGEFGEDGKIQQIFETYKMPYTGSGVLASAIAMNKWLSRKFFTNAGIKIPRAFLIRKKNDAFSLESQLLQNHASEVGLDFGQDLKIITSKIFQTFSFPWVIKPTSKGSSIGVCVVSHFEDSTKAIENSFKYGDAVMVEEFINGQEATCGILEKFRGERYYAFPVIEIIPPKNNPHTNNCIVSRVYETNALSRQKSNSQNVLKNQQYNGNNNAIISVGVNFFDYESKYNGKTREICPARFNASIKKEIENLAKKAHNVLGCKAYSRSDFIISRRGIFLLETNTLPGLTSESLLPKSALAIGLEFPDLLDHLIQLAVNRK